MLLICSWSRFIKIRPAVKNTYMFLMCSLFRWDCYYRVIAVYHQKQSGKSSTTLFQKWEVTRYWKSLRYFCDANHHPGYLRCVAVASLPFNIIPHLKGSSGPPIKTLTISCRLGTSAISQPVTFLTRCLLVLGLHLWTNSKLSNFVFNLFGGTKRPVRKFRHIRSSLR